VKAVFADPLVAERSGMAVHPQFRYEMGEFKKRFPKYTFVPGLYIPYSLYKEIEKPDNYKTIYIYRDPRDIVVSWYYSMKETHYPMGSVPAHRRLLSGMTEGEGIEYCIRHLQWKFSFLRQWLQHQDDPQVYFCRFEALTENPSDQWENIFEHCKIDMSSREVSHLVSRYSKEKMRKKDLKERQDNKSHYRKDKKSWKNIFNKKHKEIFKKVNGNILEVSGYEKD